MRSTCRLAFYILTNLIKFYIYHHPKSDFRDYSSSKPTKLTHCTSWYQSRKEQFHWATTIHCIENFSWRDLYLFLILVEAKMVWKQIKVLKLFWEGFFFLLLLLQSLTRVKPFFKESLILLKNSQFSIRRIILLCGSLIKRVIMSASSYILIRGD